MFGIGSVFHSVSHAVSQGVSDIEHGAEQGVKDFGPTVLKTGLVVTAAAAGTALGGPMGGAIAGGLASAGVSAASQEIQDHHIDWGLVAINGAVGAIPGGLFGKIGGRAIGEAGETLQSDALQATAKSIAEKPIPKYVADGVAGGAVIGGTSGLATSTYEQLKSGNPFSVQMVAANAGIGALTGAVTGGVLNRALGQTAVTSQALKTDILTDKLTAKAASAADGLPAEEAPVTQKIVQSVAKNGQALKASAAPSLRASIGFHSLGTLLKGSELDWMHRHHFVA